MKKLIYLIILFILWSCLKEKKTAPYPYSMEINPLREKIGLRVIDSTFISYSYRSESTFDKVNKIFYSPRLKLKNRDRKLINEPTFWEKHIELNKYTGKPQFEEDIYRSGFYKFGIAEETNIFETVKFKYVFEEHVSYLLNNLTHTIDTVSVAKGWHYIYEYPSEMIGVTSNRPGSTYWEKKTIKISEEKADSILSSWGLKRVNY